MTIATSFGDQLTGRVGRFTVLSVALLTACSNPTAAAIAEGDVERLETLLRAGADANATVAFSHPDFAGGTTLRRRLLVVAAVYGDARIVEALVRNGARSRP